MTREQIRRLIVMPGRRGGRMSMLLDAVLEKLVPPMDEQFGKDLLDDGMAVRRLEVDPQTYTLIVNRDDRKDMYDMLVGHPGVVLVDDGRLLSGQVASIDLGTVLQIGTIGHVDRGKGTLIAALAKVAKMRHEHEYRPVPFPEPHEVSKVRVHKSKNKRARREARGW